MLHLRAGTVSTYPPWVKRGRWCESDCRAVGMPTFAVQSSTRIIGNVVSSLPLRESLAAMWSPFAFEPVGVVMISETID
jgi:hypothetical protein